MDALITSSAAEEIYAASFAGSGRSLLL